MHFSLFSALAVSMPLAAAFPTYDISSLLRAAVASDDTCTLPASFEIEQFQIWTPDAGNNRSTIINFAYWDNSTDIQTICHYNSTSQNVAPPDITPRWGCENSMIEFIWQNTTLTMIEKGCPTTLKGFEAAGAVTMDLTCVATEANSTLGCGKDCFSKETFVWANFTSLEPTPS